MGGAYFYSSETYQSKTPIVFFLTIMFSSVVFLVSGSRFGLYKLCHCISNIVNCGIMVGSSFMKKMSEVLFQWIQMKFVPVPNMNYMHSVVEFIDACLMTKLLYIDVCL